MGKIKKYWHGVGVTATLFHLYTRKEVQDREIKSKRSLKIKITSSEVSRLTVFSTDRYNTPILDVDASRLKNFILFS